VTGKTPDGRYYVLDAVHGKWTFHEQAQMIDKLYKKWQPKVINIEKVQYQMALIQELIRTYHLPAKGVTPTRDKVTRALPMLAKLEQGYLKFHRSLDRDFEREVISFPDGQHDDYVDALVYSIDTEKQIRARI
jgi:predicted phage terminase large subunit-like protein